MHCKTCDYPLWGVTARACPECGTAFRPSDFDFAPNTVRFGCPQCNTEYFGTSERGHLVPSAFACVTCHRPVTMDEMIVTPVGGVSAEVEALPRNIWLHNEQPGLLQSVLATTNELLVRPSRFGRSLPRDAPTGPAWRYAFICFTGTAIVTSIVDIALIGSGWSMGSPNWVGASNFALSLAGMMGFAVGSAFARALILSPLVILLMTCIVHIVVLMVAKKRSTFGSSLQTQLYAFGAVSLFGALENIPILGQICTLVGFVWYLVISTHLISRVHRVGGFPAFVATAAPTASCCVGCMGLSAVFFIGMANMVGGGTFGTAMGTTTAGQFTPDGALRSMAAALMQAGPDRPNANLIQLANTGVVDSVTLQQIVGVNEFEDVMLGGVAFSQLGASADDVAAMSAALDARLPAVDEPFRIGSAIFYYRTDAADGGGDRLVVIVSATPDESYYRVVTEDSVNFESAEQVDARLAAINTGRRARGLPDLPSPGDVADLADPSSMPTAPSDPAPES